MSDPSPRSSADTFECYPDCIEGPPTCGCPYRYIDSLVEQLEAARWQAEALGAHNFSGRHDRDCVLCGKPDRHPFHGTMMRPSNPAKKPLDPNFPNHVEGCICPRFKDIAPALIADLTCPVHGVEGTDPGDKLADSYQESKP